MYESPVIGAKMYGLQPRTVRQDQVYVSYNNCSQLHYDIVPAHIIYIFAGSQEES